MTTRLRASVLLAMASWSWIACGGDDLVAPAPGEIRVTISTTGAAPDADGYTVAVDGGTPTRIEVNATLTLPADAGEHTVELGDVTPPCILAGEPRRGVTVEPGATVEVAYAVVCEANEGVLVVTTMTSGPLPDPDGYLVTVAGGAPQPIEDNGSLTIEHLEPGAYTVELGGIARNCQVEGGNPVTAEVGPGAPAVVEFRVTCLAGIERWELLASGTTADLTSVWADPASGAAFAIGERDVSPGLEGVLLASDNARWAVQHREADFRPRGVWGSSPQDVYAVGYGFFAEGARVLHFDGVTWTSLPEFDALSDEDLGFESVWGSSASDVFIVGSAFRGPFGESLIYHWDGTAWQRMFVPGDVTPILNDVWGSSATDVYAVGRDQVASPTVGVVLRYDGSTWAPVLQVERLSLNGVWASSAADVFAAGFQVEERNGEFTVRGAIWHYDGAGWSAMALPEVGVLHDIWGTSAEDVYAVGDDGLILRYDGAVWTATPQGDAILLDVRGGAAGEVYAVGTGGTILRGAP